MGCFLKGQWRHAALPFMQAGREALKLRLPCAAARAAPGFLRSPTCPLPCRPACRPLAVDLPPSTNCAFLHYESVEAARRALRGLGGRDLPGLTGGASSLHTACQPEKCSDCRMLQLPVRCPAPFFSLPAVHRCAATFPMLRPAPPCCAPPCPTATIPLCPAPLAGRQWARLEYARQERGLGEGAAGSAGGGGCSSSPAAGPVLQPDHEYDPEAAPPCRHLILLNLASGHRRPTKRAVQRVFEQFGPLKEGGSRRWRTAAALLFGCLWMQVACMRGPVRRCPGG